MKIARKNETTGFAEQEVAAFRKAAARFETTAMKSKESARATLRAMGVITATGRLTKPFR